MLKDDVLKLIYRENGYISGESISRILGVSRTAVNTAVKNLRDEGYDITSSTNRGYLLMNDPDILSKGSVSAFLPDTRSEELYFFDSVDSTNTVLKGLAAKGAGSGTVVIADHQTGGKGRRGRSFDSPSGAEQEKDLRHPYGSLCRRRERLYRYMHHRYRSKRQRTGVPAGTV